MDKNKATAIIKELHTNGEGSIVTALETLLPEIFETEDEKIRKEIINYFECQSRDKPIRIGIHNKWIDWLKKQVNADKASCKIAEKENNITEETNAPTEYGKYVGECLNEAAKHYFSEGVDKYSVADLFYAGVRCGQSWCEIQGSQKTVDHCSMGAIEYVSIPKEEYEHLKSCRLAYEHQLLEERKWLSDEILEKQQEAVKSIIATGVNFPIKH